MGDGLKALLQKKANPDGQTVENAGQGDSPAQVDAAGSKDSDSAEPVSQSATADPSKTQQPPRRFGTRKDSGSTDSSGPSADGPAASSGSDSSDMQPKSRLGSLRLGSGTQPASGDSGSVDAPSIDSLDALDASESQGVAPRGEGVSGFYSDETPATKPTRELPEGLAKEALGFVDMIDGVYEVLHEPELLGGVIRNIMIELKNNPEYMKLVALDDIRAWVRGMRESMGLAKVKKQEAKSKRGGGSKKSKAVDIDMLADLDALGID
jgi:hypothetical protein